MGTGIQRDPAREGHSAGLHWWRAGESFDSGELKVAGKIDLNEMRRFGQ